MLSLPGDGWRRILPISYFFSGIYKTVLPFAKICNVLPEVANHFYIPVTSSNVLGFCFTSVTDCMFLLSSLYP